MGVSVGVSVGFGVEVFVGTGVCVRVGVDVGSGVGVLVGTGVGVFVRVGVAEGVVVGAGDGVLVNVSVGEGVLVETGVGVLVAVGLAVGVPVEVRFGDGEAVRFLPDKTGVAEAEDETMTWFDCDTTGVDETVEVAVKVGDRADVLVGFGAAVDVGPGDDARAIVICLPPEFAGESMLVADVAALTQPAIDKKHAAIHDARNRPILECRPTVIATLYEMFVSICDADGNQVSVG